MSFPPNPSIVSLPSVPTKLSLPFVPIIEVPSFGSFGSFGSTIEASSLIIAKIISSLDTEAEPEILVKLIAKVSSSSKELSGAIGISITLLLSLGAKVTSIVLNH